MTAELQDALLSARMRSLATFAPDYFHDLKGPLNTIALRLEVLRAVSGGAAGDERRRASMSAIEEQIRRLDRMLQGWLTYTVPSEEPEAVCDLGSMARDIAAVVAPRARKRQLTFTVEVADDGVSAVGPQAALSTALLDLLRHAISGLSEGGVLGLRVERQGATVCCRVSGAGFDARATALAARIADRLRGTCTPDQSGQAAILALPVAS
jgi:signal transduction histidine kinase